MDVFVALKEKMKNAEHSENC